MATELQGRKIDTRMKPDWLNDNSMAIEEAVTEDNYIRHSMTPQCRMRAFRQGTSHGITIINRERMKVASDSQSSQIVITLTKRGLPKSASNR